MYLNICLIINLVLHYLVINQRLHKLSQIFFKKKKSYLICADQCQYF